MKKWLTGLLVPIRSKHRPARAGHSPEGRSWLAFITALLCFSSAPAPVLAADFTVEGTTAVTEKQEIKDTPGKGEVKEGATLNVSNDPVAISATEKAEVVIAGKVQAARPIKATDDTKKGSTFILKPTGELVSDTTAAGPGEGAFLSEQDELTFTMEGGKVTTEKADSPAFKGDANGKSITAFNVIILDGEVLTKETGSPGYTVNIAKSSFTMKGGKLTTNKSTAVETAEDAEEFTFLMEGGEILAEGIDSRAFHSLGAKAGFTMKGGSMTSIGVAPTVHSLGNDFTFLMGGGEILAKGKDNSYAFYSGGERLSFTMTGGRITSEKGDVVFLGLKGNEESGKDYEHVVKIGRGATIATPAEGETGYSVLYFGDSPDNGTSRALVDIAGTLVASGENGIGIQIADQTGGFHKFEISGTIKAKTAIQKADAVDLPLVMTIKQDARIIGDVNMGSLDGTDGAGEGNDGDTITVRDNARIIGDVTLGAGDDSFKLEGRARVIGLVDGGVNTAVSADNPGDTLDVTGMMADRRARAATSFSLRFKGFETIKGLPSANRKNYLVGINVKGQSDYDAEKESRLVSIEPTGQAVEARAQGILMDALHDLGDRRGRAVSERYASRPVQVAARGRMTGLLAPDTRPSVWGEGFGGFQRRGRDGFAKAYAFNHIGVAFGIEQDYRGERTRLGMLFGYVGGSFKTRPSSIKTDSNSLVLGLYGRHRLDEVRENLYLQGGLNFHFSKHDNRRQVLLSKSIAKDNYTSMVKGKYDSWGMSPSLTLGYVSRLDSRFSLEPSVNLRYSVGFYDSYREKGEAKLEDKLSVNSRTQQSLAGRLNLAGIYHLPDEAGSVALRLGLSHRRLFAGDLKGSVSGQAFQFKSAGSDNVNLLHAGLDISARLTESLSVNGRWEYASSVGGVSDHGNNGLLSLAYEF